MSSPNYRRGGESSNYRGNYNNNRGGGFQQRGGQFRGRGGYKPRRYWDNDDYYKRDRDYDRGRDRHRRSRSDSRSRSRSPSRSYSRSRSQSPVRKARSPRKSEEYKPSSSSEQNLNTPTASGPTVTYQPQAQYDPYEPQKDAKVSGWSDPNEYVPQPQSQRTNGQQQSLNNTNLYGSNAEAIQLQLQQFQKYQQQLQQQQSQSQPSFPSESLNPPVSSGNMYAYGSSNSMAYQHQPNAMYPNQQQTAALSLDVAIGSVKSRTEVLETEKSKKKKDRKKKKRRRRSSSSSSSSSDDSSDSRSRRKSKKDSDDSSDSSSDEDKKKKEKGGSTGSLTTEQKEALTKQKEGYNMKLEILDREINRLISQGDELRSSKADIRLVEENFNLQAELKGRRKAVQIVMEKINDVLRSSTQPTRALHPAPPPPPKISQPSPQVSHPPPQIKKEDGVSNIEYYDNGVHWCRLCNAFPETVVELLDHFHSKEHQTQLQLMNISERPWQKKTDKKETKLAPGAKRIPFRGVQFLSPVVGWYCRICSAWLGDHECAEQHFKSEEHNSVFLNFLAEHPDWETKWLTDRGKMLGSVNPDKNRRPKSRFDLESQNVDPVAMEEDGKSFRVQMRNTVKADESRTTSSDLAIKPESISKDVSVEEWMSKPQKVKLDIIDTQKFAAIVRQKHGQKEKEELARGSQPQPSKTFSPSSSVSSFNQRDSDASKRDDYGSRDRRPSDSTRRYDRVEMQFSGSTRDRDRYGPHRGARRRSRTRSRSRSRDRDRDRYNNRRRSSRDRSRSRSRDRDRDRERDRERERDRDRDKDKPDIKEHIRRLPMIGKMPLYKKPTVSGTSAGKEKEKISEYGTEISSSDNKATEKVLEKVSAISVPSITSANLGQQLHQQEESNMSAPSENSMSGFGANYNTGLCFNDDGFSGSNLSGAGFSLDVSNASAGGGGGELPANIPPVNISFPPSSFQSKVTVVERDSKGDKEPTVGPTGLPDDLQQALDIIYSGGGKPITVPPPSIPTCVPPPATNFGNQSMTDFAGMNTSSYGSYLGYQPYQHTFDGYGPVGSGYEELDDGPPGESAGAAKETETQVPAIAEEVPPAPKPEIQPEPQPAVKEAPPGDDEMDDLRMLGIDVDDVAVGGIR